MAKKKKPAANPARGFATTSLPSKVKQDEVIKTASDSTPEVETASNASPAGATNTSAPAEKAAERELHELSPEELETRLNESELQSLVDKYAAKSQREATRHINKLQTDCRLLRAQAQPLSVRSLIPESAVTKILQLALLEVEDSAAAADEPHAKKTLQEEETTGKLWTLQRVLLGIGFKKDQTEAALKFVLRSSPSAEEAGLVWGLDEALDWLVLKFPEEELPVYDASTGRPRADDSTSGSVTPIVFDETPTDGLKATAKTSDPSASKRTTPDPSTSTSEVQTDVSDLESDLEPDELISTYLSVKERLYELQPQLSTQGGRGSKQKTISTTSSQSTTGVGITKLQDKLKKIENDVLFDLQEAEALWSQKVIELARASAERRKLQLPSITTEKPSGRTNQAKATARPATPDSTDSDTDDASSEGDNALADLFGATAEQPGASGTTVDAPDGADHEGTVIRAFAASKGIGARRILDEACRARDSGAKLTYKLVSRSAFANRQQLVIRWSKEQDTTVFPLVMTQVESQRDSRVSVFTMKTISTPDAAQSEAYISTVALFQTFSTSAKEEKVYLRLAPAWRDLWVEFAEDCKMQVEAADRANVSMLRDLVREQIVEDDEEDIVLTRNFKKRINGSDAVDAPTPATDVKPESNEQVQQRIRSLWLAKSSTPSFQRMAVVRSQLPIFHFRDVAITTIETSQVTILCGETGCGKSTQLPAYILERELSEGRSCKIYCTEPRRISAITLAQRVSEELGEHKNDLGTMRSLVGYAIRLESQVSSATRLIYATTGIVLRMLESRNGFDEVTHIVIDEVHERSIETDFLLIILRSLIQRRPDLKVVLMSATVDAERFSNYFQGAPILTVPGRTFPVTTKFLEDAIEVTGYDLNKNGRVDSNIDYDDDTDTTDPAANKVDLKSLSGYSPKTRAVLSNYDEYRIDYGLIASLIEKITTDRQYTFFARAILVFLPGIAEIRRLHDMLSGTPLAQRYVIHALHSSIASEDQQRAFAIPPRGLGKIVLSTNIAETGVTIPDITMVIDTGKHKEMRFDEKRQISRLIESFISRANAKQRRGRAGRVQEGMCFHLFSKHRHDTTMAEQQTPEMLRLSLQDLIMRVKICKLGDIQSTLADALDPPSAKNIRRAIDALIEVDALTESEQLTPLGLQLSKLPLDPYLGKLALFGAVFGCLDLALTTAAILTSKSPFVSTVGARKQADLARLSFRKGDSDLLTDFAAYAAWRRVCTSSTTTEHQFCAKSSLNPLTLANIEDLKAQLLSLLADASIVQLPTTSRALLPRIQNSSSRGPRNFTPIPPHHDRHAGNESLLSAVVAAAFHPKLLVRDGKGWRGAASGAAVSLHPTSVTRLGGTPVAAHVRYLSYYSIVQAGGGGRHLNATSLSPAAAGQMVLLAGEVSWNPVALVVALDVGGGGRVRFGVEGWRALVALRWLRRAVEGMGERAWRGRASEEAGRARGAEWVDVWEGVVRSWAGEV